MPCFLSGHLRGCSVGLEPVTPTLGSGAWQGWWSPDAEPSFQASKCPKEGADSMFPFTPGPHTQALHFSALSSDSLTTASWQRPHPHSLRQNVQDIGSGREQGATGSWAGPLRPYRQCSGTVSRAEVPLFKRAFPRPLSHQDGSAPGQGP